MTLRTIGLDVHKRFAEVAVIEPGTGLRRAPRISTTPSALRTFARTLGADDQVVLEATANTWAIADLLAEHAGRVVVSNPMRTRAIADAKCKTDQVDAAILAQLLAADFIPQVWVPDAATRALRRQVAQRASLVQQRTRLRNRIAAILVRNLIDAPFTDTFGRAGERWLREVDLPADERAQVDCALRLLEALAVEITRADRALIDVALADANVRHLLTIPGIGPVSALSIVAVVGDIQRFSRPNQLVGYLGLDPRVHQSGERPAYTGHISRQGQAHARGLLIEAALGAVRVPGPPRAFFQRVCARRGKQVAIVALARKLVVLSWHLLSKHEDYRWQSATLTETKIRRAELAAGYPRKQGWSRRPAGGPSRLQRRELERQVLQQAEAAYRAQVAAWRQSKDAAAANGARLKGADQGQMRGGGSSPVLRSSHGVDRVPGEDSP
jgi:transposase